LISPRRSVLAYVGLGSNLAKPVDQVRRALHELDGLQDTQALRHSGLYRSAPLGPPEQPEYINAVAELRTRLAPLGLLDRLQALEARHGRQPGPRWGSRTLDLDILLYGDSTFRHDRLQIPHPELARRAFVLYPLSEMVPESIVPGLGTVAELRDACAPWPMTRLRE
jgi:2-amino-4-hydroxy-6-hydroxymethyldihydropteridine diphosphokinase